MLNELSAVGIRLNQRPPKITVQRRSFGGIEIRGAELVKGGEAEIKRILQEHRLHNAFIVVEEPVSTEEIEEALDESVVYRRAFILFNKCDAQGADEKLRLLEHEFGTLFRIIKVEAAEEELKKSIYDNLDLIRVYTKRPDEEPAKRPLVLMKGSTVFQVAKAVHKDFERRLKFARVWGSTRFPGQQVPRNYVLKDKDVVELHT